MPLRLRQPVVAALRFSRFADFLPLFRLHISAAGQPLTPEGCRHYFDAIRLLFSLLHAVSFDYMPPLFILVVIRCFR